LVYIIHLIRTSGGPVDWWTGGLVDWWTGGLVDWQSAQGSGSKLRLMLLLTAGLVFRVEIPGARRPD
jgi:hypothetical protein